MSHDGAKSSEEDVRHYTNHTPIQKMGYFTNVVHNMGRMAGQAGRAIERGVDHGFGAARRIVHGLAKGGNAIQNAVKKADNATGGLLSTAADFIPGSAQVKAAFKTGLAGVNAADKLINRAEGAVKKGKKRVREGFQKAQGVAKGAAAAADTGVEQGRRLVKKARTAAANFRAGVPV
jgi:phage-related protein